MSSTLPNFIVKATNKIQEHALIEDVEGLVFEPVIIKRESKMLCEAIEEIEMNYHNNKN